MWIDVLIVSVGDQLNLERVSIFADIPLIYYGVIFYLHCHVLNNCSCNAQRGTT